ncbi:hypothetical protein AArcMg_4075 (plasmid) [Natrarchaeobaculum sulfurireducens]|uniref:DUF8112 domain-containing protein n=1 Tax=Natrarchaeobaculum sulfurireducens TaxID=2044521 RepID=A0A346PK55_9EURY|nr:hypothetical protein AArcMg_4075 [Natrarchaeobaculum sulfurireducens]
MNRLDPEQHESIANKLIEDINHINIFALGEGAANCQICGAKLREGDPITAYAFRAADTPTFRIGFVTCQNHTPIRHFTLGVRELLVDGRIGTCYDVATQSSWPVLLAPAPRVVSPAHTTVGRHPRESDLEAHAHPEPPRVCTDGGTQ